MFEFGWQPFGILVAYSAAVVLASIFGGLLPEYVRLTHNRMQLMISFVGGVMLGIAIFHMIPHAIANVGMERIDVLMWSTMSGLLATFFLLRFFHFHQHGPADFGLQAECGEASSEEEPTHLCTAHGHSHDRGAHVAPGSGNEATGNEAGGSEAGGGANGRTRWVGVLMGLGLHTLMDGVALGAGVAAESGHGHSPVWPGIGIFMAILLHKPLDAVSITTLMRNTATPNMRLLVNVGFALMCPVGAFLFYVGSGAFFAGDLAGLGLAFSAGVFMCIALSDLLPEMEFHSHNRIRLSVALLLGILAAWMIGLAEGSHAHQPPPAAVAESELSDSP